MEIQASIKTTDLLAENLFALNEPWRGRFLTFIAERAQHGEWPGVSPTKEEVSNWLHNKDLNQTVTTLLNVWQGTRL